MLKETDKIVGALIHTPLTGGCYYNFSLFEGQVVKTALIAWIGIESVLIEKLVDGIVESIVF